ncbi:hypothetical protein KBY31_02035 [Ruegeria pomeroyi]|nr:hypothetical protein [Ruegeria pomeroyi]
MIVYLAVLAGSLLLLGWSLLTFGPILTPLMLAAALGVVIGVVLVLRQRLRRAPVWIVIDGSNVLYWRDETPSLHTVRQCVEGLVRNGWSPLLWFDANVGYLVGSQYMGPHELSRALRYPASHINVAPKGTPADPLLIEQAEELGARIVTNDRFRDWVETYPQVADPDLFLRGSASGEGVSLRFAEEPARKRA